MYAQFFGNYLLERNAVTREQLIDAMKQMASEEVKLGALAIHEGYMTASEVDNIVIMENLPFRKDILLRNRFPSCSRNSPQAFCFWVRFW